MERVLTVTTQPEGCVVDNRNGTVYIGQETGGLWRFAAGASTGDLVAPIDNRYLVADLEGLAIAPAGVDGGYLVASSQGDNAYAVFALPQMTPVGRFRITASTVGSTEETDGIDLVLGSFGPRYPQGLFVAQDGNNAPAAQNFKLVSWQQVMAALGLQ
jgi:3-phytase